MSRDCVQATARVSTSGSRASDESATKNSPAKAGTMAFQCGDGNIGFQAMDESCDGAARQAVDKKVDKSCDSSGFVPKPANESFQRRG